MPKGKPHPKRTWTRDQQARIVAEYYLGRKPTEIQAEHGVPESTLMSWMQGRSS
jgi:transposase-like protein